MEERYKKALKKITTLDPGLWQTMQDIANEALGERPRYRGKKKTPQYEVNNVIREPNTSG